jgi:hypothetical protein
MNFEIELRPHVGKRMRGGVEVEVEQDQYLIFVSGPDLEKVRGKKAEHIGFVGKKPGMPINYLKVAAAFGEGTVKVFSQMVRSALVAKARERIEQARQAAAEAEQLREESENLLRDHKDINVEAAVAREAVRISQDAIAAANQELLEAGEMTDAEILAARAANEPTDFYGSTSGDAVGEKLPASAADSSDTAAEADSQNL